MGNHDSILKVNTVDKAASIPTKTAPKAGFTDPKISKHKEKGEEEKLVTNYFLSPIRDQ